MVAVLGKRSLIVVSQETYPGHPNAAFSRHKENDFIFCRLRTAQVPVSSGDRMASPITQSIHVTML